MERFVIYGLVDPRNDRLRYIGKSTTGAEQRLASHLCPSSLKGRTHKERWVASVLASGHRPEVFVIEAAASKTELSEMERHHIAAFRALGCDLTNGTPGGDGEGHVISDTTKEKIAAAQRGVPKPPWSEARRTAPNRNKGKKRSPEAIEATARARRGMRHSPEARKKISDALQAISGPQRSEQLSRAHGGRPFRDETGRRFPSLSQAERELGIARDCIRAVLSGRRESTGGHVFTFED